MTACTLRVTSNLSQQPWFVVELLDVLFTVMLVSIYRSNKIWAYVIFGKPSFPSNIVDTNELLVQFTSSIVEGTHWGDDGNIDIIMRLYRLF